MIFPKIKLLELQNIVYFKFLEIQVRNSLQLNLSIELDSVNYLVILMQYYCYSLHLFKV